MYKLNVVETKEQLDKLQGRLCGLDLYSFDTETTGLDWTRHKIFMLQFSDGVDSWVIPVNRFEPALLMYFLHQVFADVTKFVVGQNIKFDAHHAMASYGVVIGRQWHDTLTMAYLMDENRSNRLKSLMPVLLKVEPLDETAIHGWMKEHQGKQENWDFSQVPEELMIPYAGMDPWACFKVCELLLPQVQHHFGELYETERKVLKIMWKLEQNGVLVDKDALSRYAERHATEKAGNLTRLFNEAGSEFNPDSPDDLQVLFYERLKLPVRFLTEKGEPSTKDDALIAMDHPVAELLQVHRTLCNRLNYAKGLLSHQDSQGLVHGDYSLTRTKTGRFACSEPNLQNPPKDPELRKCFVASKGLDMFYFDHAQIEMVGFAHYSKDIKMVAALQADQDLHALAAAEVYGIPISQVTKDQRAVGKGTNFSIIYGVGKKKLASYINGYMGDGKRITDAEAAAFKERYFTRFPSVPRFQHQAQDAVRTRREPWGHYVRNQWGRVRRITDPVDCFRDGKKVRGKAYTAVNHLIQGWAPDLMKRGMVLIEERLCPPWRQNIHDELRIDLPHGQQLHKRREMVQEILRCLTHFPEVRVPVKCKVEWSDTNWAEVRRYGN